MAAAAPGPREYQGHPAMPMGPRARRTGTQEGGPAGWDSCGDPTRVTPRTPARPTIRPSLLQRGSGAHARDVAHATRLTFCTRNRSRWRSFAAQEPLQAVLRTGWGCREGREGVELARGDEPPCPRGNRGIHPAPPGPLAAGPRSGRQAVAPAGVAYTGTSAGGPQALLLRTRAGATVGQSPSGQNGRAPADGRGAVANGRGAAGWVQGHPAGGGRPGPPAKRTSPRERDV